jgi:hypothetical protein
VIHIYGNPMVERKVLWRTRVDEPFRTFGNNRHRTLMDAFEPAQEWRLGLCMREEGTADLYKDEDMDHKRAYFATCRMPDSEPQRRV